MSGYCCAWEKLKKKAEAAFLDRMAAGYPACSCMFLALRAAACSRPPVKPAALVDEWVAYGLKLIRGWDVRCVSRLVDCFPEIIPEYARKSGVVPTAWMEDTQDGESCEWYVSW